MACILDMILSRHIVVKALQSREESPTTIAPLLHAGMTDKRNAAGGRRSADSFGRAFDSRQARSGFSFLVLCGEEAPHFTNMNQLDETLPQTEPHFHEEIAPLAHSYWEQEGQPQGKADEHWHRAEWQLISSRALRHAVSEM
jgi:hypothetical protein